jgi:anti-sigma factor RsiW
MSIEPTLMAAIDCSEVERSIDPYLDGEFETPERVEIDAHLAACPRCATRIEGQARMRAALRAKLREAMQEAPPAHAPAALRGRITTALARTRRPLWRRALTPLPVSAAAACAAGVLFVLATHGPDDRLIEDAIRKHHRDLPYEITMQAGDGAALPEWFKGKLDFNPTPPRFKAAGVQVLGARLSNLREWPAAYIRYQLPRGQAGLFIVDDPQGRFDASGREIKIGTHTVHLVNARGYNVAVWRQDEIVYSLVSDLDADALFQLVQTAQADAGR